MNYLQLQTELENPEYDGLNATAIVALLNEPSIEYFIEPPTPEVTNFLFNNGMYMKLLAVYRTHEVAEIRVAAEAALDLAQSQIPNINLQNPNMLAMLTVLVAGEVWTQTEADSLLDFGKRYHSKAEVEFGQLVSENDINRAQWSEQVAAFVAVRDAKLQELATVNAIIADLEAGNAYHELSEVE